MMKTIFLLFAMLALVGRGVAFDTTYAPDQHAVILAIQCDDRVDSQFVNLAREYSIPISFAPYSTAGATIIDYDSLYAKGGYTDAMVTLAAGYGMYFSTHAQRQSPTAYNAGGGDSLLAVWDAEQTWLKALIHASPGVSADLSSHVWTGHVNSPRVRALAKNYGYTWTRGALSNSKDLYLSANGWANSTGAEDFIAPAMLHRALVPSFSAYRLTNYAAAESLWQASTVADTTHLWKGTREALNVAASHNALIVLNIHPGWGAPHAETEADSIAEVWAGIPTTYAGLLDSIRFATRRGKAESSQFARDGRNDVSAYQLDYILRSAQYWADSTEDVDGVSRLCVVNLNEFMRNDHANFRNDNSSDTSAVSDWWAGGTGLTEAYWTSNTGLYARDPALDVNHKVYIDGTGDVKAGNGTHEYPLPRTAWDHLFNCDADFINVSGDTLTITTDSDFRCGNVDLDFGGLRLLTSSNATVNLYIGGTGANYYQHNITLRNGTFDNAASTNTNASLYIGQASSAVEDSLRAYDVTLYGMTFENGERPFVVSNSVNTVADSCFFTPGAGAASDETASSGVFQTSRAKNLLVRNSLIDMSDCGIQSVALYNFATLEDSLRFINNVVVLGNAGTSTDAHYAIRTDSDSTATNAMNLRYDGNYIANSQDTPGNFWRTDDGNQVYDADAFITWIKSDTDTYEPLKLYDSQGYAIGAFDYTSDVSDTLRFGGYKWAGSAQTGSHASIGPIQYAQPLITLTAAGNSTVQSYQVQTVGSAAQLYLNGFLSASDSTDASTFLKIERPRSYADQSAVDIILSSYEALPDSQKVLMKIGIAD